MRYAYRILIFIAFLMTSQLQGQDWNTIITFLPGQTLQDVLVTNDSTVYAVSSLNNGQGTGLNIKKSTDNGNTWTQQQTNIPNENFRNMATSDGETVFVIGNNSSFITNNGTNTWSNVNIDIPSQPLRCIFFVNDTVGWLGADGGTIYKTMDGGQSWFDLEPEILGDNVGTVSEIYFLSESRGFIAGSSYLKLSEDGGQTWNDVPGFNPNNGVFNLREIQFLDEDTGFLCGDLGLVARSQDGGATWVELETPTTESIQDIKFLDKQIGYACGFGAVILSTTDGGNTWTEMTADQSEPFRAIDFSPTRGFITTQNGDIMVLELTTSTSPAIEELFEEVSLYPNPTQDRLYLAGLDQSISIFGWRITNFNGQTIRTSQSEIWPLAPIDLSTLSPGTYIFSLETSEGWTNKLLVKQ